jgi:hypothetical protein
MKLKGLGVNACIELFRLYALQDCQRSCRLTTAPGVICWSSLLLLATEINFNISTELFGLSMTENGEERKTNNVSEISKIT